MQAEWDEAKRQANLQRHGLDFADAVRIFESYVFEGYDDRADYGEDRWIAVGLLDLRPVVMTYTEVSENVIRVISLRKALTHEREQYEQALRDRLGPP